VLGLCKQAGLVSVGVVAIDGTKVRANAKRAANRSYEQIAREILAEAAETDRREDELYGDRRGDELPEQLRTPEGRKAALRKAKEELERERGAQQAAATEQRESGEEARAADSDEVELEPDPQRFVSRGYGRREWFREGRRALDQPARGKSAAGPALTVGAAV
jgi:hypothetical protein